MKKVLGLDLGTNSVGWALVDKDAQKILGMGSRIIPMGTDKQDYEKGSGITKNANRRDKRTARKMNKRYKLRRNKLLFILDTLGMLPDQFQFKDGIPRPNKLQELELLPIRKGTLQLDSLGQYELCVNALNNPVELKEFGKILYKFNQLRGYSGGNNDDNTTKKQKDENENEDDIKKKTYEVISQKVEILSVKKSDETFTVRSGINKGEKQNYFIVTIKLGNEEKEGKTELQNLEEKIEQEEELEIRIRRNKTGEETSVVFALPQKSNWRKAMETDEKILEEDKLFISELRLRDLNQNKWTKIRNRVFLRNRYKKEFDQIWRTQAKYYPILNDCPKDILEKIANYIFPGESESQQQLREQAIKEGLKYIIKEQVIYYQRPLKPQTELISNCRFEKDERVIATSHPLFQEFRCWKQINNLYITSKQEVYSEKKKKNVFRYVDRYLTNEQKQEIYNKLQVQKQVGFNEVRKIVGIKDDKTEYLNGLNVKAKLIGCDTSISIKKILGDTSIIIDSELVEKIWEVIFDVSNHEGSEYDAESKRVSSVINVLENYTKKEIATELALKLVQNVKFPRKYASLSEKAIQNILPLMRLNPQSISEQIKNKFENIKRLIETGEIVDNVDYGLEEYVIDSVKNNPNILETGGLMEYLAISLVYGKHTTEIIKAEVKNYHDIKYIKRNLRNPIVEQLLNETMQVVKAVWKQYKINPEDLEIRVELARDLKNSAQERENIFKGQLKSKKINDKAKEKLQENNIAPTGYNILKYRLYEQQNYISPYTGKPIEISKLFDDKEYDVDHILPKSRYYDDSLSNKVVIEKNINIEKDNRTAWEYITQQNSKFKILSIEEYVKHINEKFFGKKKKNLLAEKIPTNPIERQLKDTQYISVAIKSELAKIVGSENVKTSTGEVTDFLRSRWGLRKLFMELTESRFKQMELWDLDKDGNPKTIWITKYYDQEKQEHIYEIKNWSKRYDNRHHAIDALIVALTEQSYIQRLNNLNKYVQDELTNRKDEFEIVLKDDETILDAFFNFEEKRRDKILREIESSRYFEKPFSYTDKDGNVKSSLIKQVREHLETMIVSIKPKDKLGVSVDEFDKNTPNKQLKKQIKIRGALHQETYYGQIKGRDTKRIELSSISITKNKTTKKEEVVELIDKVLESEIITHRNLLDENGKAIFQSTKEAFTGEGLKMFNDKRIANNKQPVYKVKVWYNKEDKKESSLQRIYKNNEKQSVVTGDNYLFLVMEKEMKKSTKRVFDIASLYDSVNIAKDALNEDISDVKRKIAEDYRLSYGERNKVRGKVQENPDRVLFTLQQNELVYLPIDEEEKQHFLRMSNNEFEEWIEDCDNKREFCKRVYKVVKFSRKDCFFIPHNYANTISIAKDLSEEENKKLKEQYGEKKIPKKELNFVEFGSYQNCSPYDSLHKENKIKIQDMCIKIQIDWLGNITIAPQF